MTTHDYQSIRSNQVIFAKGRGYSGYSAGEHVGTVDRLVAGKYIQIKRQDAPDHRPHWFPIDWIAKVDDGIMYLDRTLEEFERGLIDTDPTQKLAS